MLFTILPIYLYSMKLFILSIHSIDKIQTALSLKNCFIQFKIERRRYAKNMLILNRFKIFIAFNKNVLENIRF